MSQSKGSSRQSDASRKLGKNSTEGQTIATIKKQQEAAQKAAIDEQVRALIREQKQAYQMEKQAKQREVMAQNRKMVNEMEKLRRQKLLQEMPAVSEEQQECERRMRQRRAALNRALH